MKNLLFTLLTILLYCGCKKEQTINNTTIQNGTYRSALTSKANAVLMYTRNGILTDTNFIKKFLLRNNISFVFNYNRRATPIGNGFVNMIANGMDDVKISVIPEMGVPLALTNPPFEIIGHIANWSSTDFLIQATKADTTFNAYKPDSTLYSISKYKSFYKFNPYSPSSGYINQGELISWSRIAIVNESGEYYFPILRSISKRHLDYDFGGYSDDLSRFNSYYVINPNLSNEIGAKDTIVVQQELVRLIKQ